MSYECDSIRHCGFFSYSTSVPSIPAVRKYGILLDILPSCTSNPCQLFTSCYPSQHVWTPTILQWRRLGTCHEHINPRTYIQDVLEVVVADLCARGAMKAVLPSRTCKWKRPKNLWQTQVVCISLVEHAHTHTHDSWASKPLGHCCWGFDILQVLFHLQIIDEELLWREVPSHAFVMVPMVDTVYHRVKDCIEKPFFISLSSSLLQEMKIW